MSRVKARNTKKRVPERTSLGSLIKSPESEKARLAALEKIGSKKEQPGRKYSGSVERLSIDNAEYLYMSNSYIRAGVDTNSAAITRNGMEIVPTNTSDQKRLDLIIQFNDLELIVEKIAKTCELHGTQFVEVYFDQENQCERFELLPTAEMDYKRDSSQNILYDKKTGKPSGYVQKRNNKEIASWNGNDAKRIIEFKYTTLGGTIEGIPGIQSILYSAQEYGYIRSSLADSFIRSLPVAHIAVEGATPEDISEVTSAIGDRFTARTTYVTSERFKIENTSPRNDVDVFKFIEPTLSEMAAAFHMPIEMFAPSQYLKADDFIDRYQEWVEHIKFKQKIIASIFEHEVFSLIFNEPVKVRFNNPASITTTELIKNVGFAVQSGAISEDLAFDILNKNHVFGTYISDLNTDTGKPTGETKKAEPTKKSKETPESKPEEDDKADV